eukprot:750230-Hanusia_phi.AAC.2
MAPQGADLRVGHRTGQVSTARRLRQLLGQAAVDPVQVAQANHDQISTPSHTAVARRLAYHDDVPRVQGEVQQPCVKYRLIRMDMSSCHQHDVACVQDVVAILWCGCIATRTSHALMRGLFAAR